jgi:hypothetical protein
MREAWQTPHGARPNREGVGDGASRFQRVPARCAKLPGRSLEPFSNGRPRGMTVTAAMPYRIRLTGSDITCGPCDRKRLWGLSICNLYSLRPFSESFPCVPSCPLWLKVLGFRFPSDSGNRRASSATPPGLFRTLLQTKALNEIHPRMALAPRLGGPCVALGWPKGDPIPIPSRQRVATSRPHHAQPPRLVSHCIPGHPGGPVHARFRMDGQRMAWVRNVLISRSFFGSSLCLCASVVGFAFRVFWLRVNS